jgi:NADPH-dependent curcumin reductase CurA
MTPLVDGSIGPEAKYDLEVKNGEVVVTIDYKGADARAKLEAALSVDQYLEKLKAAIPGKIDDYIIDALKKAMS